MPFGFSFGSNKTRTTANTTMNKTENTNQSNNQSQNQTTAQQSNTSSTGTANSQNTNVSTNQGTSSTTGTSVGQQTQVTKNFSDSTLAGLEGVVSRLLSANGAGSIVNTSQFNPATFIAEGMRAAQARTQTGVDEAIGGILDAIGGRNNSAAALLTNRVNSDASASLAGTHANLVSQAEEISRNNLLAGNQVAATQNSFLTDLLASLRGGVSSTTGTTQEQTAQTQQTQNTGTESGTQSQTQTQNSQTQSVEQIASVLTQLIQSLTNTSGTENVVSKGKSSGFGVSLT